MQKKTKRSRRGRAGGAVRVPPASDEVTKPPNIKEISFLITGLSDYVSERPRICGHIEVEPFLPISGAAANGE